MLHPRQHGHVSTKPRSARIPPLLATSLWPLERIGRARNREV